MKEIINIKRIIDLIMLEALNPFIYVNLNLAMELNVLLLFDGEFKNYQTQNWI